MRASNQPITDENFSKAYTEERFQTVACAVAARVDGCPFALLDLIQTKIDSKLIFDMLDAEEEKKYIRYWCCFGISCMIHLVFNVAFVVFECLSTMRLISGREIGAGLGKIFHMKYEALKTKSAVLLNVDVLYSFALVDLRDAPVTIILPEKEPLLSNPNGVRYQSAQITAEENYYPIEAKSAQGKHVITEEMVGSRYCFITVRTQVNPLSKDDMLIGEELRKRVLLEQDSKPRNLQFSTWNRKELLKFQKQLLKKSQGGKFSYGKRGELTLAEHNKSTAQFGGLPPKEAAYIEYGSKSSLQTQTLTLKDVPVESFWSVTIYKSDGTFADVDYFSVNSSSVTNNEDGSVVLWFGTSCPECAPNNNFLKVFNGWKACLRLYSPTNKYHSGEWQAPPLELAQSIS